MAQKIEAKEERPLKTWWLKNFLPVDTTDSRLSLPNDACMYDLMNAQPIGYSNLHSIADISNPKADYGAHVIFKTWNVNIAGTEYLIAAALDGTLWAYSGADSSNTQIASGLSGTDATDMAQYEDTTLLIIDTPNAAGVGGGYFSWAGTGNIAPVNATGGPSSGQAIAVYQNMVWIAQGRTLWYTKAGLSTDTPPAYTLFADADGGGSTVIRDSALKGKLTALFAANGFLYVWSATSIWAVSDVYVPTVNAVPVTPPTPVFTLLNLSAIVGTDQPRSILAYGRLILFANKWGAWMLYGTTVQRISGPDPSTQYVSTYYSSIDGTWQYLSFTHQVRGQPPTTSYTLKVSGGQVVSNRLLAAAFLVYRENDPIFGTGPILLMWQSDAAAGKWWSAYYGNMTQICTMLVDDTPALFAVIDNRLYQLFADLTSAPAARMMTALWDFGDPIVDKQALRAGIRINFWGDPGNIVETGATLFIDTTKNSYKVPLSTVGVIEWKSDTRQIVDWQTPNVDWVNPYRFLTYWGAAPQCFDKHLGFTLNTMKGTIFELNAFLLDYKQAARWGQRA